MKSHKFYYPEPLKETRTIIPIFIPFMGCPKRCIYCSQDMQTGSDISTLDRVYARFLDTLKYLENSGKKSLEIAFFGGTFTGISIKWLEKFLYTALEFKQCGIIEKVRCSTRPDYIDFNKLELLKELGMDIIELGIQTFDNKSLFLSKRGYDSDIATQACSMVKQAGFELGIQLLPGLPGFSSKIWLQDIKNTIQIGPKFVRIYPCVVLKRTVLERMYLNGEYNPLELKKSIRLVGLGVLKLWRENIHVIRIGLHNEKALEENIVAGPWDPGYGSLVKSYILFKILSFYIIAFKQVKKFYIPLKFRGQIWGRRGIYRDALKKMGIGQDKIEFTPREYFEILY